MDILKNTYRALLATILSVLVIYGTSGIYTEKHSCEHCGTDYSIALFSHEAENPDTCCSDAGSQSEKSEQCEMTTDSCCSFETESIELSEQLPASSQFEHFNQSLNVTWSKEIFFDTTAGTLLTNYYPPDKPGGRTLVIVNSQFRT